MGQKLPLFANSVHKTVYRLPVDIGGWGRKASEMATKSCFHRVELSSMVALTNPIVSPFIYLIGLRNIEMWESLAASVIFFVILIAFGSGCFLMRRCRLLKLFRVSKDLGLTIYLSRLQIIRGGSVDFHGTTRSFTGPVVTAAEASAATVLGSIFEYLIPGLESQPGILKTLFTRDITVSVQPSPTQLSEVPPGRTIIAVGSPGYNCVSEWIENALNPLIRFNANNSSIQPQGLQAVTDPLQGMVQVLWDANSSRRVFYVAGISEAGTTAALLYLGRKWDELRKNLGRRQVYACLVKLQHGEPTLLSTIHPS